VTLIVVFAILSLDADPAGTAQAPYDVKELADYRLTEPVFQQFERASRLIATATRQDPRFEAAPLFTREVAVSGDAPAMAAELEARLQGEPVLADALHEAKLTPRDYTKFALALFAARLAHGFVKAGVLARVPAGVAADNVEFVEVHQAQVSAILAELGVEG
jgi:hypothetical protein